MVLGHITAHMAYPEVTFYCIFHTQGDTHYLLYIYDMLKKQLHDEGNGRDHLVRTVFNRSKEITLLKYQKPAPVTEDSHQVLHSSKSRNPSSITCKA